MPFDSNGVFSRVMNWTSDQQNGIAIECGRHDAEDDNFAEGFNNTFCRDGRSAATGDFNLGQHKIQNLANGTATTDAVNKGQLDSINTSLTSLITTSIDTMLSTLFPVGSIYIGTQSTCPLASLISGSTWTKISGDKVLQSSSSSHAANTTIAAGLPNITGSTVVPEDANISGATSGAFKIESVRGDEDGYGDEKTYNVSFNASRSSSIYGNSSTVQPPAYVVNVWRRTA